jgi:hypothetical protein
MGNILDEEEMWAEYEALKYSRGENGISAAVKVKAKYALRHTPATIQRKYYEWRSLRNADVPDYQPPIPAELVVPFDGPYMLLPDLHIPTHHTLAVTHALAMARAKGIKQAILVGDTHNLDYMSRYMSQSAPGSYTEVMHDLEVGYQVHDALCNAFDKIYVIKGNHDTRILKNLQKKWGFHNVWRVLTSPPTAADKRPSLYRHYTTTERYYLILQESPVGDWLVCHQRNYSVIQGRVAQRLAGLEEMNVVTSHEHGFSISNSGTKGRYYSVACPGLVDPVKTEYKEIRPTLHPKWTVGWGVIWEDGKPELFDFEKEFGNWGLGRG